MAALRASDPVLRAVIDSVGADNVMDPRSRLATDHYGALVRSIVGQQLSTISAGAIYGRLKDRYGGRTPTPQEVLDDDPDEMRVAPGCRTRRLRICGRWPSMCSTARWISTASTRCPTTR